MKAITEQANNKINIVGKLLDVTPASGTLSDGRAYERATITVRVNQTYGNRTEVSEIPVSMFATQFTQRGTPNPAYKSLQDIKHMKTAQNVGFEDADTVRLSGATISENVFVTRTGQLVDGWQLRASFANTTNMSDVASFALDIFIMDMHPETDRDGDTTGRLIIKGGIVQYGSKLDVIEFIVEQPESVDYIERNWNINDTVSVVGRIRVTSIEKKSSGANSSWGEDIPETTTTFVRELIITKGDDEGKEEDFAYDAADIKKAFNVRKANIEQLQINAKNTAAKAANGPQVTSKYSWE